jgi:hypothetical protein
MLKIKKKKEKQISFKNYKELIIINKSNNIINNNLKEK